jgi:hypothetical protein
MPDGGYDVFYENGVRLGILYREIDGYFVFGPEPGGGSWSGHVLRDIADKIEELNKPWDQQIQEYFR